MSTRDWIVSERFDAAFIFAPALLSVAAVLGFAALRPAGLPLWGWITIVMFVDGAHSWAILHRTYLDPDEWSRRKTLFLCFPPAYWLCAFIVYSMDALVFWRLFAAFAYYHVIRQQYGFMRYYQSLHREPPGWSRLLDSAAIYAAMLYPLLFRYADPSRSWAFVFMPGDMIRLPAELLAPARALYQLTLTAFAARQAWLLARGRPVNRGKIFLIVSTSLTWYVGIVHFNSGLAGVLAITIAHGLPYLALIWIFSARKWSRQEGRPRRMFAPDAPGVALYLGFLCALAYGLEFLREIPLHIHGEAFFGITDRISIPPGAAAFLVTLTSVPPATHYFLDAFIWRLDASNPDLKRLIFDADSRVNS
ncbi:MAG: hypothetical protein AAB036_10180 [Elusimicrobiota bacterium]